MSKVGKIIRFVNNAMDKLTGISTLSAFLPPNSEKAKITHPKNRLIGYIAPVPASLYTALGCPSLRESHSAATHAGPWPKSNQVADGKP